MLAKLIKSSIIIDPNKYHAQTLAQALVGAGVNALKHYANAAEGLEGLLLLSPCVIFIDQDLGEGRDGVDLTHEIRRNAAVRNRRAPIILTTNKASALTLAQAIEAGASAMLAKPFAPGTVAAMVRKVVETPRAFIETEVYVGPCRRWGLAEALAPGARRRVGDAAGDRRDQAAEHEALVTLLAHEGSLALLSGDRAARALCRDAALRLADLSSLLGDIVMGWAAQAAARLLEADAPESWKLHGAALFEALALFKTAPDISPAAIAKRDQIVALINAIIPQAA
jgi:two-component system, chemotaxis family, chemotaxis protein CheY